MSSFWYERTFLVKVIFSLLLGVAVTSLVAFYDYQLTRDGYKELANERLHRLGSDLERAFYKRVSITNALEAFVQMYSDVNLSDPNQYETFKNKFEGFAESLDSQFDGVMSIQLAPDAVVTFMSNPERNRQALGHDLLVDDMRRDQILVTIEKRTQITAGPLNLIQGGEAVITRQAIFTKPNAYSANRYIAQGRANVDSSWLQRIPNDFWGLATVLIDIQTLYREAGLNEHDERFQFSIRGRHGLGEEGDVFWGDEAVFINPLATVQVALPDGYWVIAIQLRQQLFSWHILVIVLMGLVGTGLLVYTVYDIAKRKQIEAALLDAVASQKAILTAIPDLLFELDDDGRYLNIWGQNPELLASSKELLLGRTVSEMLPTDAAVKVMAALNEAYERGQSHGQQIQLTTPDGDKWFELSTSLKDKNSSPHRFIMLSRDISERKKAEEELRQAAAVFENANDGVIITDAQGCILTINQAAQEITGYSQEEVLGKKPSTFKSERHTPSFYQAMWQSLNEVGQWRGEIWNRRKNGEIFPSWQSISSVRDNSGDVQHYVSIMSDISVVKESQERLQHLAHHDPLTNLPNRLLFNARLKHSLERAHRENCRVGVMFLDLDNFKPINDGLGHPVGDKVLQAVAERLAAQVREEDTVARISGDEFAVILEDINDSQDVEDVAAALLSSFEVPLQIEGQKLHVTTSIGISLYPEDGKDENTLVKNADAAMYRAKEQGKNRYCCYTLDLTEVALKRLRMENDLRMALKRNEFRVYYQPQYSLTTGQLIGAEALIRWAHPEKELVSPVNFIPLAESTGLIIPIGRWILHNACAQTKVWQDAGFHLDRIGVNVAGQQIQGGDIVQTVREVLEETGLTPQCLELEITESFIMQQPSKAITTLGELQNLGVTLAIDDFGTGYSSLSYLKRLPIDKLKIDRSFIKDVPRDSDNEAITKAIIALGKSLQLKIIAEGVETKTQMAFVNQEGCDEIQGFYYSQPIPEKDFFELLKNQQ